MKKYTAPDLEKIAINPNEAFSNYAAKCNPSQLDEVGGTNVCPEVNGWDNSQCYINLNP